MSDTRMMTIGLVTSGVAPGNPSSIVVDFAKAG